MDCRDIHGFMPLFSGNTSLYPFPKEGIFHRIETGPVPEKENDKEMFIYSGKGGIIRNKANIIN
ncbi:MAG: hypothetical protein WAQ41_09655 [bacterium]|jgi:hypothetical protein